MLTRRVRRGQAEVIGGIIAISLLIVSTATIYFLATSTQSTATTEFAKRTSFEAERDAERVAVMYEPTSKGCIVSNVGAVVITIVRTWDSAGKPEELKISLPPGESISSWTLDNAPDLIVTSRGNVFAVKGECQKIANMLSNIPAPGGVSGQPFTSKELINPTRMTKGMNKKLLYAVVDGDVKSVIYYNGTKWLCSDGTNSYYYSNINGISISGLDLDYDSIYESIINDSRFCRPLSTPTVSEYNKFSDSTTVSYVFINLINIPENGVDTITVYFKIVVVISLPSTAAGGGDPHVITISPFITIAKGSLSFTAPATTATVSRGLQAQSGYTYVVSINGYAIFPVRGFNFGLNPGMYNLTLSTYITKKKGSNVNLNFFRLEYIAVVGAEIADPWR